MTLFGFPCKRRMNKFKGADYTDPKERSVVKAPRVVRQLKYYMVMSPIMLGTKNHYAGECQQQLAVKVNCRRR
jgi:hypothetical protein